MISCLKISIIYLTHWGQETPKCIHQLDHHHLFCAKIVSEPTLVYFEPEP